MPLEKDFTPLEEGFIGHNFDYYTQRSCLCFCLSSHSTLKYYSCISHKPLGKKVCVSLFQSTPFFKIQKKVLPVQKKNIYPSNFQNSRKKLLFSFQIFHILINLEQKQSFQLFLRHLICFKTYKSQVNPYHYACFTVSEICEGEKFDPTDPKKIRAEKGNRNYFQAIYMHNGRNKR